MREDVPDVDDLPSVLDRRDEPILISADVEYRERARCIGVRKVGTDIGQMSPCGSLGYAVPMQQRLQRVLVRLAKFGDRHLTDDPHRLKVTKTVTISQREVVSAVGGRSEPGSSVMRHYVRLTPSRPSDSLSRQGDCRERARGGDSHEKRLDPNCSLDECRRSCFLRVGILFCNCKQGHSNRSDCKHFRPVNPTNRRGRLVSRSSLAAGPYLGCCYECCYVCSARLNGRNGPTTPSVAGSDFLRLTPSRQFG